MYNMKLVMHFYFSSVTTFIMKQRRLLRLSMISGFYHDADEICALLGHYTASNGNPLPFYAA
jgi:hypothetical protein